jgi:hypothetical protein
VPVLCESVRVWLAIMKIPIMQFSPVSCYILSLRAKYSPQHVVFKRSHCVLPCVRDQISHKTAGKNHDLVYYVNL